MTSSRLFFKAIHSKGCDGEASFECESVLFSASSSMTWRNPWGNDSSQWSLTALMGYCKFYAPYKNNCMSKEIASQTKLISLQKYLNKCQRFDR